MNTNNSRRAFMAQGCAVLGSSLLAAPAISRAAELMTLAQGMPVSPYVPPSYQFAFGDNFDDTDVRRINENAIGGKAGAPAWRSRYRWPRKDVINQEKQIYVDRDFKGTAPYSLGIQPFSIHDGMLTIRAQKTPANIAPYLWNYQYTSGVISSELTYWRTYGYFEIRARMPRGKGFWPAFWLLPKAIVWPPEIDIFEISTHRPRRAHCGVIQLPAKAGSPGGVWVDLAFDVTEGFHVYGMDWTATNIVFFIDGKKVWEYGSHNIHGDMYMLANLALGSHDPNWVPDPDETTPFPGLFDIGYIRVYRHV